jgi:hypothetical protein
MAEGDVGIRDSLGMPGMDDRREDVGTREPGDNCGG